MTDFSSDSLRDRVADALRHQYQIEDEIGRGGMAVVYRARDLRLERLVAIKVLPPELAHDPALGTRFTREAQTSAQLAHAHIVPIYDVGERDGIAYFVMALVDGGNVAQLLEHQPRRPVDEVRRLLCETADALAYAHLRGVIHRDMKPDNILLDAESGRAMVTDFGIARAIEGGARLTLTGAALGTPTYMSPEQAVGERDLDGRSDLYSLGVLGYQMLTGRPPFSAGNSMALLLKHVSERPRPIAELRPEAPKAMCEAIERALKKAPEDRWPTAAAFRDALIAGSDAPTWRSEREPVRYTSPLPRNRRDASSPVPRSRGMQSSSGSGASPLVSPTGLVLEPAHLASLTPEQRDDLRIWAGRVHLLDRVKAYRRFAALHGRRVDVRHDRLRLRLRRGAAARPLSDRADRHDGDDGSAAVHRCACPVSGCAASCSRGVHGACSPRRRCPRAGSCASSRRVPCWRVRTAPRSGVPPRSARRSSTS